MQDGSPLEAALSPKVAGIERPDTPRDLGSRLESTRGCRVDHHEINLPAPVGVLYRGESQLRNYSCWDEVFRSVSATQSLVGEGIFARPESLPLALQTRYGLSFLVRCRCFISYHLLVYRNDQFQSQLNLKNGPCEFICSTFGSFLYGDHYR